ncbi:hypothetical protein OF846_000929 [Rhodotorula toruloides]|nr:hypothetical protein OF846_000929 [Rhodotorula toruloides]
MTSVTVKVTLPPASDSDDAITRSLLLPAEPAPSWGALAGLVQQRFSLDTTPAALTYIDGQEDEITVSSSEEVAELWATALDDGPLSFNIGSSQTRASTIDTGTLLASVRHALESDPSLANDLHNLIKSAGGSGGQSRHPKGRLSPLHGCRAHRRHGEMNGKFGRGGGRRGGRGGVTGFRGRHSAHHSFDCPDESSGSESETLDQSSEGEGPAPHFSRHHGARCEPGRHCHRPHHAFGPPPLFPPPPPFAFGGFPAPSALPPALSVTMAL